MEPISSTARACAITGADGFLGSYLCDAFQKKGWIVYKFVHHATADGDRRVPFSLDQPLPPDAFRSRNIQLLIHAAYDKAPAAWEDIQRVNVQGSLQLLEAAQAGSVKKIIFISSISSHEGCRSLYGKAKLEIEQRVSAMGGEIVRPCLIYNEPPGGLLGTINRFVAASPIIPVIQHSPKPLFLVHREDLANLILYLADKKPSAQHLWIAASPQKWTLGDIVKFFAKNQGKKVFLVPIPWQCAWVALKALEFIGIKLSFRSDSILGLVYYSVDFPKSESIPVSFRNFGETK